MVLSFDSRNGCKNDGLLLWWDSQPHQISVSHIIFQREKNEVEKCHNIMTYNIFNIMFYQNNKVFNYNRSCCINNVKTKIFKNNFK